MQKDKYLLFKRQKKIIVTGGYLSQNMGSVSMSIVSHSFIKAQGYSPVFLSKYPGEDRAFARKYGIKIQKANQFFYTFFILPVFLFSKCIPGMTDSLVKKLWGNPAFFFDIGGITFSRDRSFPVFLIHATWLALPLLSNIPVIKGSQAMGPFDRWYHRLISLPMLRKTNRIHARGNHTFRSLKACGIRSIRSTDLAFLLETEDCEIDIRKDSSVVVTIIPSVIVMQKYNRIKGCNVYTDMMSCIIKDLIARRYHVRLLAHSYRFSRTTINNDYPLCKTIYDQISHERLTLTDVCGKTPGQLKTIIGSSCLVFSGRFHGMVSALSSGVPVIVTSWSHKYKEVLMDFGLEEFAVDWRTMTDQKIMDLIHTALADLDNLKQGINANLPKVKQQALTNFEGLEAFNGD